jgi:threonine dehydratase
MKHRDAPRLTTASGPDSGLGLPTLEAIRDAARLVYQAVPPTPQYAWPLLCERAGAEVWVKHENHTPIGAFKVRGGLVLLDQLKREHPGLSGAHSPAVAARAGVVTATKGNHGQSIGFAAKRLGIPAVIVVPKGNSVEKNNAMRALGVELIEHGDDFQEAREHAEALSQQRGLVPIPPFHAALVRGVATCGLEFLSNTPPLDAVYVPIGMGSGLCAMAAARQALNLSTRIIGVVSDHAPAYALSFQQNKPVPHPVSAKLADGLACRQVDGSALKIITQHAERIVRVTDAQVAAAMRHYFTDTHNVAEGAAAAPLAALLKEKDQMAAKRVGLVLTGGNVDAEVFAEVLAGRSGRDDGGVADLFEGLGQTDAHGAAGDA